MEENVKNEVIDATTESQRLVLLSSFNNENVTIKIASLLQWGLIILGLILIFMSIFKYGNDLDTYNGEYKFDEISYVGGDAYNCIISAARSTAVMVKSLILAVLGSTSLISGLLLKLFGNKK